MDIGCQFEDDFFEEPVLRKIEKSKNYEPKIYKKYWFMASVVGDGDSHDVLVTLKHKADYHYSYKNFAQAAEAYGRCLELVPPSNNTWKREFLENLARSLLKLGDAEKALEWSLKLDESSINEDQKVISMNLLALVCHSLGKFKEELEALHSCMHAHKAAPEFWLRLGLCYAGLFKINLPTYSIPKMAEDEEYESEPCCAFGLKRTLSHKQSQKSKQDSSLEESANCNSVENGACSNSSEAESLIEKCDFCLLGIQIVSSCLIRTRTLIDSGGTDHLRIDKNEQIKEKISNSLAYMEVDQSFIEIASKMLGTDFFSLTDVCSNAVDSKNKFTEAQNPSSSEELV